MTKRAWRWMTRKRYRLVLAGLGLIVLWVVVHLSVVRLTAGMRRVRVYHHANISCTPSGWPTVRIATFNIAHGRGPVEPMTYGGDEHERFARLEAIGNVLSEVNADVVVLNEVDFDTSWSHGVNQAGVLAELAGYPYRLEQRNVDTAVPFYRAKFGNAVLSRYPITEAEPIEYPDRAAWQTVLGGKKRGALCTIAPDGAVPFSIVAVHIDHNRPSVRRGSATVLVAACKDAARPVVLAGDFNSTLPGYAWGGGTAPETTAVSMILKSKEVIKDETITPESARCTFHAQAPDRTIDWILIPPTWTFLDHEVICTDLTDHCLVVATCRAPQ